MEESPDLEKDRFSIACQIADSHAQVISIRMITDAADVGNMRNLSCDIRECMVCRIQSELPECLPHGRTGC